MSAEPVDTEFGRKPCIHQSLARNKDFSCHVKGFCPSLLTITPMRPRRRCKKRRKAASGAERELIRPIKKVDDASASAST